MPACSRSDRGTRPANRAAMADTSGRITVTSSRPASSSPAATRTANSAERSGLDTQPHAGAVGGHRGREHLEHLPLAFQPSRVDIAHGELHGARADREADRAGGATGAEQQID